MPSAKRRAEPRGREETERRLVAAVEEVLREGGVQALGVNAIAQRAGVDKVLLYRYFDGLPGLLRRYAESGSFWPTLDEILGADRAVLREPDPARLAARALGGYARALRARPITLALLGWECVERDDLTRVLEEVREQSSARLFAELAAAGVRVDEPRVVQVSALFGAAINYLAVRARHIQVFGGMDIGSEAGWADIESAIEAVFRGLLASPPEGPPESPPESPPERAEGEPVRSKNRGKRAPGPSRR